MRAVTTIALVVALVVGSSTAGAAESDLAAARRRANEVASELAAAQTRMAELEAELGLLEAEAGAAAARRTELQQVVRDQAVEHFVRGGASGAPPVLDPDPTRAARANALARFVTADTDEALDEYRSATERLEAAQASLADVRDEQAAAVVAFRERAAEATAELERQERLEAERRAREEAERRAREEAERRARAAEEAARVEAERQRRAAAAVAAASRPTTTRPPAAPARSAPRPAAPAPTPAPTGGWLCPVQGARAFTNDWGQPRSGGRRHQGTDILSPRGTPVVANVSGTVRPHQSSLGGISYYLRGDDGTTYFGTHLDSLSGASGRVAPGTVLGYVGNSGNARGGPTHLHFEIHPGGGGAVNPYPTLSRHC